MLNVYFPSFCNILEPFCHQLGVHQHFWVECHGVKQFFPSHLHIFCLLPPKKKFFYNIIGPRQHIAECIPGQLYPFTSLNICWRESSFRINLYELLLVLDVANLRSKHSQTRSYVCSECPFEQHAISRTKYIRPSGEHQLKDAVKFWTNDKWKFCLNLNENIGNILDGSIIPHLPIQ